MKKSELTPKRVSYVPCPTCGVANRKSCVLNSGAPRSRPHVDRRFAAIEAAERKSGCIPIPDMRGRAEPRSGPALTGLKSQPALGVGQLFKQCGALLGHHLEHAGLRQRSSFVYAGWAEAAKPRLIVETKEQKNKK
jgi:hypothetical protein